MKWDLLHNDKGHIKENSKCNKTSKNATNILWLEWKTDDSWEVFNFRNWTDKQDLQDDKENKKKVQDAKNSGLMGEEMNFAKFEILKVRTGDWIIKNEFSLFSENIKS